MILYIEYGVPFLGRSYIWRGSELHRGREIILRPRRDVLSFSSPFAISDILHNLILPTLSTSTIVDVLLTSPLIFFFYVALHFSSCNLDFFFCTTSAMLNILCTPDIIYQNHFTDQGTVTTAVKWGQINHIYFPFFLSTKYQSKNWVVHSVIQFIQLISKVHPRPSSMQA